MNKVTQLQNGQWVQKNILLLWILLRLWLYQHPPALDLLDYMGLQLRQSLKLTKKWRKAKGQVQSNHLTAWTLGYLMYPLTGCNPLYPRLCGNDHSRKGIMLWSWALFFIFYHFLPFPPIHFVLLVTCSPLVPLCTIQTATQSPDRSPDKSLDHSAVNYHTPLLCSPQFPLFTHYRLPAHCQLTTHYL